MFLDLGDIPASTVCLFIVFILNGSLLILMIIPSLPCKLLQIQRHMNMDHMKSLLCPLCSQYNTQEGRGAASFCDRISFQ